jgi:predicted metal-dependent peptidase
MDKSTSTTSNADLAKHLAEMTAKDLPKVNHEAKDRLDSAISKLIIFKPIFGTVFMFLNKIQNRNLPTMGVGVIRRVDLALYYNPEWIETLTSKELRAVLTHEALHVLLHHIARADHFDYNRLGYNIAADMAINCHVTGLPEGCFYPNTFKLPDFESSEWYYEKLKKQSKDKGKDIGQHADGKGQLVDSHDSWGECEDDVVKEKIRGIADKCVKAQDEKGWSDIGSGLAKAILDANKPVVNWKREVRYFINKLVLAGRRTTRTRINRREQSLKKHRTDKLKGVYIHPGTKRDYTSKLLVSIDTSGSVSDAEVQAFLSEINGMIEHVKCDVTLFDAKILMEPVEIKKKIKDFAITGRGGTSFAPIIRYVDEHQYDGLIIMTDGFAPFPAKPKARVLWAISPQGDSVIPPYGKRVRVEIKPR